MQGTSSILNRGGGGHLFNTSTKLYVKERTMTQDGARADKPFAAGKEGSETRPLCGNIQTENKPYEGTPAVRKEPGVAIMRGL